MLGKLKNIKNTVVYSTVNFNEIVLSFDVLQSAVVRFLFVLFKSIDKIFTVRSGRFKPCNNFKLKNGQVVLPLGPSLFKV